MDSGPGRRQGLERHLAAHAANAAQRDAGHAAARPAAARPGPGRRGDAPVPFPRGPGRHSIACMAEHEHSHAAGPGSATQDTNEAIWKSEIGVTFWKSTSSDRERRRGAHRVLLAELLPFRADEAFTFVDLGAGTGAAARTIMDHYPAARAILADYSPQMMAQGVVELEPYAGRYEYVEFDLA